MIKGDKMLSDRDKIKESVKAVKDLLENGSDSNLFLDGQLYAIDTVLRLISNLEKEERNEKEH